MIIRTMAVATTLANLILMTGCTSTHSTHTARTAREQLLISNSIDQSLEQVNFSPFQGRKIFIDARYLDCVDKNYLIGSLRHRAINAGAALAADVANADIVLEVRSGALGTDNTESFLGVPEVALPGPVPISIPEVKLIARESQAAVSKLGLLAYDAKTGERLGYGGVSTSRSDDNNWFIMGVGPFQNGSVRSELSRTLPIKTHDGEVVKKVSFDDETSDRNSLKTPVKHNFSMPNHLRSMGQQPRRLIFSEDDVQPTPLKKAQPETSSVEELPPPPVEEEMTPTETGLAPAPGVLPEDISDEGTPFGTFE